MRPSVRFLCKPLGLEVVEEGSHLILDSGGRFAERFCDFRDDLGIGARRGAQFAPDGSGRTLQDPRRTCGCEGEREEGDMGAPVHTSDVRGTGPKGTGIRILPHRNRLAERCLVVAMAPAGGTIILCCAACAGRMARCGCHA